MITVYINPADGQVMDYTNSPLPPDPDPEQERRGFIRVEVPDRFAGRVSRLLRNCCLVRDTEGRVTRIDEKQNSDQPVPPPPTRLQVLRQKAKDGTITDPELREATMLFLAGER